VVRPALAVPCPHQVTDDVFEVGQVSDERVHQRDGYRPGEWDTRAGTVELAVDVRCA
jgi:hypothetical protein